MDILFKVADDPPSSDVVEELLSVLRRYNPGIFQRKDLS